MIVEVWDRSGPRYQFLLSDEVVLPLNMRLSFGPLAGRSLRPWIMQDGTVVYLEAGVALEAVGA